MSSPTVSVILPTYNRSRFLGEAIRSALSQSAGDLEVIVVDDGSSDSTPALLDQLQSEDSRVRAFRQENAGVSAARNRALREARGKFIAFLDSDDVWKPWKLELQLAMFQARPEIGMVWTNMDAIGTDGRIWHESFLKKMYGAYKRLKNESPFTTWKDLGSLIELDFPALAGVQVSFGDIYRDMFQGNLVHTPTVLVRKEWVDKVGYFDTSMRRGGEDFKFHLATSRLGPVGFIDSSSILYRTGIGDHITNRENNLHFARSFMRTLQEELKQERATHIFDATELNNILANAHEWLAEELCSNNIRMQAVQHAFQTILLSRRIGNSWRVVVKSLLPVSLVRRLSKKMTQQSQPPQSALPNVQDMPQVAIVERQPAQLQTVGSCDH